jgi:TonB-dependent starch-binding outer membrane protein SusC
MKKNHNRFFLYCSFPNEILRIMKLTTLFLIFGGLCSFAGGLSQDAAISVNIENGTLTDLFNTIEQNTEYKVFYKSSLIHDDQRINLHENQKLVSELLHSALSDKNLTYDLVDKVIIITSSGTSTQKIKVTGAITDAATNEPLIGVNIIVEGTSAGTISDMNGKYSLEVPGQNSTLVYSYVGYLSQSVMVSGQSSIDIKLVADITKLQEVVVVGYGVQKKETLTGAVTSTKGDDVQRSPATNLTNNLVGRLPGLVAVTRSGEPGDNAATLRIRGSNTLGDNNPLIVVDGIANRDMGTISASDIESISVLKDASAAIYGAQAANGVIIVTTKRGKSGEPKLTVNINGGVNQPTRIPKMANAAQYATMLNEIAFYKDESGGRYQKYSEDDILKYSDGSDPWGHPNTDWFGETFKKYSSLTSENVSLSGGTEKMKYFISAGTKGEDGYYKNSATKYNQYNFRSNIDGQITKNITLSFDVAGRQEVRNYPTSDLYSIFRMLMRGKPNMPAYWPDGSAGPDIEYGLNPVVTTTKATGYKNDKSYTLETNGRVNITIPWIKGLSVQGNASFDKSFDNYKLWEKPWYLYSWDGNADHILQKDKKGLDSPQLTQQSSEGQGITWNIFATYDHKFLDKHYLKFMVGTERQKGDYGVFSAFRKNFISSEIDQLFAGAADEFMTNGGYASQSARVNYFGRLNYDYSQKYLLEFVWRYDGSYMFPKGKQFGFFPGLSGGWRISEENFWKDNISLFNMFKIRASWGQTGNDRIDEYQYLSSYGFLDNERYFVFDVSNNALVLDELRIPNPNVTWEVANQSDFGFDAQLLNNKLTISADYFYNLRSHILWYRNASVPVSSGLSLPRENIGKVKNQGFEAVIGYRDRAGELTYDISVNGSYSKNEIVFWDETPGIPEYQRSTGRPMGSELYYKSLGVFKDQAAVDAYPHWADARPGDIIFEDVNKDGTIDGLDMVRNEKNDMPRLVAGFNLNMQYRHFDLAILVQGAKGSQQYIFPESGEIGNYFKEYADDHWTPENTGSSNPRVFNWDQEYWASQANTYWIRSTDYLRLKNIEIGYTLPVRINQFLHIDGLRIYLNGLNLITFDKVKVQDPESNDSAGRGYPLQRIVNAGLTVTF